MKKIHFSAGMIFALQFKVMRLVLVLISVFFIIEIQAAPINRHLGTCESILRMKAQTKNDNQFSKKFNPAHFFVSGKSDAKATIIFIPGGPGLGFDYLTSYFDGLGTKFRLVFYNPGFTQKFDSVTLETLADELHQIQSAVGGKVGFVAHSGGSFILLEYFKKYNELLPAAFISGIADMSWTENFHQENKNAKESVARLIQKLKNIEDPEEMIKLRMLNYIQDYFPEHTQAEGQVLLSSNRYFPTVTNCIETEIKKGANLRDTFCTISAPFLILAGEKDQVVFPSYSIRLYKDKKESASLYIVENSGHFGFVDNNEVFNSHLSDFFVKKIF